jgi:2-methylisocitrate lyase-like PEP mutase family enzyme
MDMVAELRRLLKGPGLSCAPGVYDGVSAHLVRQAGFPLAYFTGGAVAASGFGVPDIGLVTASQMAERLEVVVEASALPVIADADTGYGNAMHVVRTVRQYERAGAAAIQLEDQTFPKRCGHLAHKHVTSVEEYVGKLRAALDARTRDTVIIARTDAAAVLGIDEAIARGQRYAAEGRPFPCRRWRTPTAMVGGRHRNPSRTAQLEVSLMPGALAGGGRPLL